MSSIIKADGSETQVEPKNGSTFSLQELQEAVGGYIEMLTLPSGQYLILNEEGKLKDLPTNGRASLLAKSAGVMSDDYVVGDVIVVDPGHMEC